MRVPWVNILLLILLLIQTISGYFGFTNGREAGAWILWVHGIVAYAILLLMVMKAGIILDAWRRKRRWTGRRVGFLVSLVLLGLVLITGLLWTFDGPVYLGGFSLVSLHIYVAVPLMLLMLWHAWHMRFVQRLPEAKGRRLFLGSLAAALGGMLLWFVSGRAKAWVGVSGAARRFTGSYEVGSLSGQFPEVSWIADRPPMVDTDAWQLIIAGAVEQPLSLSYGMLLARRQVEVPSILDCTGGWYTVQRWSGVFVVDLLREAGVSPSARSISFESITGYRRRFAIEEAGGYLLALGILSSGRVNTLESRLLTRGHGYPARLVAPGKRGVEWVKWVTAVHVSEEAAYLQSPLPLQ